MRNRIKLKTPSRTPPFFSSSTSLQTRLPPPPAQLMGMGDEGYSWLIKLRLCYSFLLMLFPSSILGSLPWDTVLQELLQHGSFPQAAALHQLFQHRSFPQDAVLQEQTAPAWVPHAVTGPARIPAPAWAPLHGIKDPARNLPQSRLSKDCRLDIYSTVDHYRTQEINVCHYSLHHSLLENLCSGAWSTSSPSFFTDLGMCRVVSVTYDHSSLPAVVQQLFPLFKCIITEALPTSLIGSALASAGSVLKPIETSSV